MAIHILGPIDSGNWGVESEETGIRVTGFTVRYFPCPKIWDRLPFWNWWVSADYLAPGLAKLLLKRMLAWLPLYLHEL